MPLRYPENEEESERSLTRGVSFPIHDNTKQNKPCDCGSPHCNSFECLNQPEFGDSPEATTSSTEQVSPEKVDSKIPTEVLDEITEVVQDTQRFHQDLWNENIPDSQCLCSFRDSKDRLLKKYIEHFNKQIHFTKHLQKLAASSGIISSRTVATNFNSTGCRTLSRPQTRKPAIQRRIDQRPLEFLDEQSCSCLIPPDLLPLVKNGSSKQAQSSLPPTSSSNMRPTRNKNKEKRTKSPMKLAQNQNCRNRNPDGASSKGAPAKRPKNPCKVRIYNPKPCGISTTSTQITGKLPEKLDPEISCDDLMCLEDTGVQVSNVPASVSRGSSPLVEKRKANKQMNTLANQDYAEPKRQKRVVSIRICGHCGCAPNVVYRRSGGGKSTYNKVLNETKTKQVGQKYSKENRTPYKKQQLNRYDPGQRAECNCKNKIFSGDTYQAQPNLAKNPPGMLQNEKFMGQCCCCDICNKNGPPPQHTNYDDIPSCSCLLSDIQPASKPQSKQNLPVSAKTSETKQTGNQQTPQVSDNKGTCTDPWNCPLTSHTNSLSTEQMGTDPPIVEIDEQLCTCIDEVLSSPNSFNKSLATDCNCTDPCLCNCFCSDLSSNATCGSDCLQHCGYVRCGNNNFRNNAAKIWPQFGKCPLIQNCKHNMRYPYYKRCQGPRYCMDLQHPVESFYPNSAIQVNSSQLVILSPDASTSARTSPGIKSPPDPIEFEHNRHELSQLLDANAAKSEKDNEEQTIANMFDKHIGSLDENGRPQDRSTISNDYVTPPTKLNADTGTTANNTTARPINTGSKRVSLRYDFPFLKKDSNLIGSRQFSMDTPIIAEDGSDDLSALQSADSVEERIKNLRQNMEKAHSENASMTSQSQPIRDRGMSISEEVELLNKPDMRRSKAGSTSSGKRTSIRRS